MDAALVERARAGDRDAMEELLEAVAPLVHRFGRRMCRHEADAEDVLQDTLLSITQNIEGFEGRSALSSWVFTLARTACARRRRGLKNQPHASTDALFGREAEGPSPEAAAGDRELRRAVEDALRGLPRDYREVILLRDMEGLTAPEVAEVLGLSASAVKSRLHRARAALREALRDTLERGAPPPGPSCPDVLAELSRKLEGELDAADCATMESHVASCGACSSACNALRSALGVCRAETEEAVPPEMKRKIKDALRDVLTEGGR